MLGSSVCWAPVWDAEAPIVGAAPDPAFGSSRGTTGTLDDGIDAADPEVSPGVVASAAAATGRRNPTLVTANGLDKEKSYEIRPSPLTWSVIAHPTDATVHAVHSASHAAPAARRDDPRRALMSRTRAAPVSSGDLCEQLSSASKGFFAPA